MAIMMNDAYGSIQVYETFNCGDSSATNHHADTSPRDALWSKPGYLPSSYPTTDDSPSDDHHRPLRGRITFCPSTHYSGLIRLWLPTNRALLLWVASRMRKTDGCHG